MADKTGIPSSFLSSSEDSAEVFNKLKTLTGLSPVEFLREMRIKKAAQLILADEGNMAQIAYQVGFNDSHYFSKCFKQVYGVTPTEYKSGKENRI